MIKPLSVFFFAVLICCMTSCNGQSNTEQPGRDRRVSGKVVNEPGNNMMLVYQDKKNNYWFGSYEDGVYRYDGKQLILYTTADGLAHNRIEEMKEDKEGNMYFNTKTGICKFNGHTFEALTVQAASPENWKLHSDDLWFKSPDYSGYVYRYDGSKLYHLKIPATKLGDEYVAAHPTYPSPYGVYTEYKDSHGNIWFGTGTLGACRFNGKTFDWISEEDVTEIHDGPANGVRSIIEDKDGYYWFNTMYRYKVQNISKTPFYTKHKGIGSLDGKAGNELTEYLGITKDNNKALWIVTYNAGVWHYDGKQIRHYRVQDKGKDITLFSIYTDNAGNLWLGSHENGAFKFNGTAFEKFLAVSKTR